MVIPEYDLEKGINLANSVIQNKIICSGGRKIVLVGGGSSSGKTSKVALKIKEAFGDNAILISADDYYHGAEFMNAQAAKGNVLNWDQIEAVDQALLLKHLIQFKNGETFEKPIYDVKTGQRLKQVEEIFPTPVIIVEGLFVLDSYLATMADLCIFVEIGPHGRMIRRLFRDIDRTGQNMVDIFSYFTEIVNPMHEKYIESTKVNAHLIISNEYDPEKEAYKAGFCQSQLKFRGILCEDGLRKIGAERVATVFQRDRYFNPLDRDLSETDEIIRIREEAGRIYFAYKGPRKKDVKTMVRPFVQFEISNEKEEFFRQIYRKVIKVIEKTRVIYNLDGVIFTTDSVCKMDDQLNQKIDLGKFIEMRGSEEKIKAVAEKLDLNFKHGFQIAYFEM